jgi:hypothetical protein
MSGGDDGAQNLAIALRVDRQLVLEIPGREGPVRRIVFELDLATLQCLAIGASEDRQQHAGMAPMRQGVPVDVERPRVR